MSPIRSPLPQHDASPLEQPGLTSIRDRAHVGSTEWHQELKALIGLIYQASIDTPKWQDVAVALSEALGGHSVTIRMRLPDATTQPETYRSTRIDVPDEIFARHWERGLPWGSSLPKGDHGLETTQQFTRFETEFPNEKLAETDYYKEWMAPQGFAPVSPMVHVFAREGGVPTAAVIVFERTELGPIEPGDFTFANQLIPHFAQAHRILDSMRSMRREQRVFREVMDRIPTGIWLVDQEGRVVTQNRSAELSVGRSDKLRIENDRLVVDDADENRWLEAILAATCDPENRGGLGPGWSPAARRSAGEGRAPLLVAPLLAPASESTLPDITAMIFMGTPRITDASVLALLHDVYDLTRAEAELAQLLADGLSIEQAAERRAVTLNTARSQLKRVFSKTGAKRQADLVRIVLGGVASMRGDE